MKKELTCIVCPTGCSITVEINEKKAIVSITGNSCKRGEKYSAEEVTAPKRTVTALVKVKNGKTKVTSVKTSASVPKELIFKIMDKIDASCVKAPAEIGDVVIENVLGTGADVIVTRPA